MGKKIKYLLIGISGAVVIIIIVLTILVWPPSFLYPSISPDAKAKSSMAQLQAKAELIKVEDNSYNNLSCNYDDIIMKLCNDIEKRVGMKPIIHATEDKYCAYINLSVKKGYFYCIDNKGNRGETAIDPASLGYCDGKTFICPTK